MPVEHTGIQHAPVRFVLVVDPADDGHELERVRLVLVRLEDGLELPHRMDPARAVLVEGEVLLQAVGHDVLVVFVLANVLQKHLAAAALDVVQHHERMGLALPVVVGRPDGDVHVAVLGGPARRALHIQDQHRGLVLVDEARAVRLPLQHPRQRLERLVVLDYPGGQLLPDYVVALPAEHLLLAVQRQMVVELGHDHAGHQGRGGRDAVGLRAPVGDELVAVVILHARVDPVVRPVVPFHHEPPGDEGDLVDDLVPVPLVFHPVPEVGVGGVPVVADVEHGGVGGCRAQGGPRLGLLPEMGFHGALLILGPGCGERLELREQRFHLLGGRHVPHGRAEPDELAQFGDQPVPLAHLLGEIQDDFPELVPVLAL